MPRIPQQLRGNKGRQIHLDEEYEVRHWVLKWSVPSEELKRAIQKVGPFVEDVRRELGK